MSLKPNNHQIGSYLNKYDPSINQFIEIIKMTEQIYTTKVLQIQYQL